MPFRTFSYLFLCIAILQLVSEFFTETLPVLQHVVKPLIMLTLSLYFWREMREQYRGIVYVMQVALFFSWLGDIFLMYSGDRNFILGLGSFLLAQAGYSVVFYNQNGGFLKKNLLWALPFAAYGVGLLLAIWQGLEGLKAPVTLYAVAILVMGIMALNRRGAVADESFTWVLAGALLFILSDSLIALNKFAVEIPLARTWIMATYMAAQYLIVMGYLRSRGRAIG